MRQGGGPHVGFACGGLWTICGARDRQRMCRACSRFPFLHFGTQGLGLIVGHALRGKVGHGRPELKGFIFSGPLFRKIVRRPLLWGRWSRVCGYGFGGKAQSRAARSGLGMGINAEAMWTTMKT